MSHLPETLTVLVNVLATGSSLLLLRRGPSRRLKLLILAVGIMSMAQLSGLLWSSIASAAVLARVQQVLVGLMALYALSLLYDETRDRNLTDFRLRLAEHERKANSSPLPFGLAMLEPVLPVKAELRGGPSTDDLLAISYALGNAVRPQAALQESGLTKQ